MNKLYQFPFSHYCEKARWALDYKSIAFHTENLLPGFHTSVTKKLAPKSTVPILVDGTNVIQGSGEIITYLDQRYPDPPLTPDNPEQAREALEWETYVDEEIGVTLRLWFYFHLLPDEARAVRFLLDGSNPKHGAAFRRSFPRIRNTMLEYLDVNPDTARTHRERLLAAMEKLDEVLQKRDYLVGEGFTRADLATCALLERFVASGPAEEAYLTTIPEEIVSTREKHKDRPYFKWVQKIYNTYRIQGG